MCMYGDSSGREATKEGFRSLVPMMNQPQMPKEREACALPPLEGGMG